MYRGIPVCVDHDLGDSSAIAQIDEQKATVVAALVDPPHEHSCLASVGRSQRSAHMSAM